MTRYKTKLIHQISAEKNRFQKIPEDANIKLPSVLNDVFGATGTKIINHILSCESYQPEHLLQYVHGRVNASREDIKEALTCYINPYLKFMMKPIIANIARTENTVAEVDAQMEICIEPYKAERELLETTPGVVTEAANKVIAEVSVDMGQFLDQNHLAS